MAENEKHSMGLDIAAVISGMRYEEIPADVIHKVKLFTLDTLGVIAGAAQAPGTVELLAALEAWEADGKATMLLNGSRVNPASAALANGAAAHSLDFDDQHDPARVHVFCVILPAVLAAIEAEDRAVTGREMLAALVGGAELFCRLGLTCYNSLGKGWHPTTTLGSIAAAAATASVFRLDCKTMVNAMGLALMQLGGTTQSIADGVLSKRMGPGFGARSGLLASHLAQNGLTGPYRFLEGDAGLFKLHERGEVQPKYLMEGLGVDWHLRDLSMKPFPCCRCAHTTIQIALEFRAQGIGPEDIESGLIELGDVNQRLVGAPFDPHHDNPVVHAQFNAAYSFAAALVDGRVGIETFSPARIRAEDVAFARRFETVESSDYASTEIAPARVTLTLKNGRTLVSERLTMKGSPEEPMSEREVFEKFDTCMRWGFSSSAGPVERLKDTVMNLDLVDDSRVVIDRFRDCQEAS